MSGTFTLYKDGEFQSFICYDDELTMSIEYGTLFFADINRLQCDVMMGDTVCQQQDNYTIVESKKVIDAEPRFRVYAHGGDTQSPYAVFVSVCALETPEQWHAPVARIGHTIEFTHDDVCGEQAVTQHYYFDAETFTLSGPYSDAIWLGNGNIIYYSGSSDGKGSLVVQDALAPAFYDTEIQLEDNQKSASFLISAEMLSGKELYLTYYKESGGVARVLYMIEPRVREVPL